MIEDLLKRRSIRKFKATEVPDELLNELFTAAFQASTTGNMQLYSVVVTKDKKTNWRKSGWSSCASATRLP